MAIMSYHLSPAIIVPVSDLVFSSVVFIREMMGMVRVMISIAYGGLVRIGDPGQVSIKVSIENLLRFGVCNG